MRSPSYARTGRALPRGNRPCPSWENDFAIRIRYNDEEHFILEQGESARLTFPGGGDIDFTCDVPGMGFKRKAQTLSYQFPDGFNCKMKFATEGSMIPQLVALEIED